MQFLDIHKVIFAHLFSSNPQTAKNNRHVSLLTDIPLTLHSQAKYWYIVQRV